MKKFSIGLRLTLWYLAVFTLAQFLFGAGMWLILRQSLYSITDEALHDRIDDMTRFLQAQKKDATVAKMQEEVSEAYILEHSGDYLQVYGENGDWIYRSRAMTRFQVAPADPESSHDARLLDLTVENRPFRLLTQRVEANQHLYTVQTALPMDQAFHTLSLFRRYLLMFAPVLLLVAAGGGYWLSKKALSPVNLIILTVQKIGAGNLSDRLEIPSAGDELQRLSETLNGMLERIESAFLRVTQFTADASHELRTPISLIRAESEIALRKSRSDRDYREALRHILMESERMTSLIEQLLTLARADSGREYLELEPIDLRTTVEMGGNEWRPLIESRDLKFKVTIPNHPVAVLADSSAIHRLIAILLENAVKYTAPPGEIHLDLEHNDQTALLMVRDTGIGIPDEHQARIFERFYREDKARSRNLGGNGIGLSIAQWIVQQHKGTIVVESQPGQGSCFIVSLPLRSVDAESVSSGSKPAQYKTPLPA